MLFGEGGDGGEIVADASGAFEVEFGRGGLHFGFELGGDGTGAAGEEGAEIINDAAVVGFGDAAHAGGGAFVNVAEQAGASEFFVPVIDAFGAGADGKDSDEEVEGFADGPGMGVGAEVADTSLVRTAVEEGAGYGFADADSEGGVGFIVAVFDVEVGVVFFNPRVFELERLDFTANHGPFDLVGGGDHAAGAGVELGEVVEVGGEAGAKVFGFAHVDDPAGGVAEFIDARVSGNVRGAVCCRVSHGCGGVSLRGASLRACIGLRVPGIFRRR